MLSQERNTKGVVEIRDIAAGDSIEALTRLLHSAYARLGDMGLNYTAVDQSALTTAERIKGNHSFVAAADGEIVGTIVVKPPKEHRLAPTSPDAT